MVTFLALKSILLIKTMTFNGSALLSPLYLYILIAFFVFNNPEVIIIFAHVLLKCKNELKPHQVYEYQKLQMAITEQQKRMLCADRSFLITAWKFLLINSVLMHFSYTYVHEYTHSLFSFICTVCYDTASFFSEVVSM